MAKIIGICGGSGAGKSTLCLALEGAWNKSITLLALDNYYKPLAEQQLDENGHVNFDLPTGINFDLLVHHLSELKAGKSIEQNVYGFNNPNISKKTATLNPAELIVVEGVFLLADSRILAQLDFIIYLDAPDTILFERRMQRDIAERDITPAMVAYQWENHFLPIYRTYLQAKLEVADMVVDCSLFLGENQIQNLIEKIEIHLSLK